MLAARSNDMTSAEPDELELSILMPCLNEAETLERCIVKAKTALEREGISGEVLIGDNGSTDGSQELARSLGARVIDVPVKGYGAALLGGFGVEDVGRAEGEVEGL